MSALAALQRGYDKPEVRDYLDFRRKHQARIRRTTGKALPLTALGLIGAGMGATWVGDHSLTPEDRSKLDNLNSLASRMDSKGLSSGTQNPQFSGSSQMFYDYVDRASQAASAKLFGKSAPEVIERIRKSPIMRGSAFDLNKANKFDLMKTEEHYGDFQAGPLAAYLHQLRKHDETFGTSWGATQTYVDPGTEDGAEKIKAMLDAADTTPGIAAIKSVMTDDYNRKYDQADVMKKPLMPGIRSADGSNSTLAAVLNQFRRQKEPGMDTFHEFRKGLEGHYNEFLKGEGVATAGDASSRIREISKVLPHGAEMDLVRKFKGWVSAKDPEFAKTLGRIETQMAGQMAGPSRMYSTGGNIVAKLFQDIPRAVGSLAVAGGAGLGTWWLYSKLREHSLKKKLQEKQRAARGVLQPKQATMTPLSLSLYKLALSEAEVDRLIPDNLDLQGKGSEALLMPGAYRTAGRATGLAESLGNEVPMTVKHPRTTRWILQTLGLGLGMTAGSVVGSALGKGENEIEDTKLGLGGMGLGGLLGYAGSSLYDSMNRREQVKEVKEKAKQDLRAGEYASPAIGQGSLLSSLVSGVHQQGRADTAETIALGKKNFKGNPGMAASQLLGLSPLTAIGSLLNTGEARGRITNASPQAVRQIQ